MDHAAQVAAEEYFNAFCATYRLAKHSIANKAGKQAIKLLEHLGCEVKAFQHRSPGSEREIIQLIAKVIQDEVVDQVKSSATFGFLVDDKTDVTSKEQMIIFIHYYCRKEEKVKTKLMSVERVLEQGENYSVDAATLFCSKLMALGLDVTKVGGMASDGASVMLGCNNGVAGNLTTIVPSLIVVHCISYWLALSCADSNQELSYIEKFTS